MGCRACGKNSLDSPSRIFISCEGDYVCDEKCKAEEERQKKHFYDNVISDDAAFANWMGVPVQLVKDTNK